jgi:hypothetical protein
MRWKCAVSCTMMPSKNAGMRGRRVASRSRFECSRPSCPPAKRWTPRCNPSILRFCKTCCTGWTKPIRRSFAVATVSLDSRLPPWGVVTATRCRPPSLLLPFGRARECDRSGEILGFAWALANSSPRYDFTQPAQRTSGEFSSQHEGMRCPRPGCGNGNDLACNLACL